jgi:myo-inositol-1(or 4)-monophosphatase
MSRLSSGLFGLRSGRTAPVEARDTKSLLAAARLAARKSAALLLEGYRSRPGWREKRPKDLVTEFDLRSEAILRDQLASCAPGIPLVAEEGGGEVGEALTWYCDPLDGTTNYVHGHPFWAVSIGLVDRGQPLLGVILAPALGIEWWGGEGLGAHRNDSDCRVSQNAVVKDALVATGFPPDRSTAPENNLEAFGRVIRAVRCVRRCGSAAIDCCMVADGTYDAYWERRLNAWDLAGGCAVALAAGGTLTRLDGGAVDLTEGYLLLSNGVLHHEVLVLLAES